jgi:hypothetical protein
MRRDRRLAFLLLVCAMAASWFIGGRMGDVSLRDPTGLAVMVAMLGTFFAVLLLAGSGWPPDRREP